MTRASLTADRHVLRTHALTKVYDGRTVVDNVNLAVRAGEIYGFLGPNGAGKSTTIKMVIGLVAPTRGRIELFGQAVQGEMPALRARMGVVGEHTYLYDDMTAFEYLTFFARMYPARRGMARAMELLEQLHLLPFGNLLVRDFSQGMQKKISLIRALLHEPELLILDEPVSGLDPTGIRQVREILEAERRAGHAVFISSHLLSEVERTTDRVGIIHHGQLLMEDSLDTIRKTLGYGVELRIELKSEIPGLAAKLRKLPDVSNVRAEGNFLAVSINPDARSGVSEMIAQEHGVVVEMKIHEQSLEDIFVQLTES